MKSILISYLILFFLQSDLTNEKSSVSINYDKPLNKYDKKIKQDIINSQTNEFFIDLINNNFKIDEAINIVYGYNDGPRFSYKNNTIYIPYSFIHIIDSRFKAKYKKEMKEKVFNSLLHTLFHELAHLLIFVYEIPVVGKEEDAADGLANILLLEFYEKGTKITQDAAELFLLESKDIKKFHKKDFWDEHSLDIQRYYNTMCYIYGKNPKKNAYVKNKLKYDKYRSEFCEDEYELLYSNWFYLLEPIIRK